MVLAVRAVLNSLILSNAKIMGLTITTSNLLRLVENNEGNWLVDIPYSTQWVVFVKTLRADLRLDDIQKIKKN